MTCKEAYKFYFGKLIDEKIIDEKEGERIIQKIQNLNEIELYLKINRHINDYIASQQLNNIYMKNKIKAVNKYYFNFINIPQEKFIENLNSPDNNIGLSKETCINGIKLLNQSLDYSYISNGICNALIFLDEKYNINNKYKNYNFNPWKGDLIYSKEFKNKREKSISDIASVLDYKGEISDDESSLLICDTKVFDQENIYQNELFKIKLLEVFTKKKLDNNNSIKIDYNYASKTNLSLGNKTQDDNINNSYNNTENIILNNQNILDKKKI